MLVPPVPRGRASPSRSGPPGQPAPHERAQPEPSAHERAQHERAQHERAQHEPAQGGPGPAVPAPGEEAGGTGGRHRRLFAVLVLAGALCALAGVALVIVWRVGQDNVARSSPPASSAPKSSLQERFDRLLGTEARATVLVRGAVDQACRPAAPQSRARALLVAQVGRAGDLYRQVLREVTADHVALSAMAGGGARSSALARAAEASAQAAGDYGAWLDDLQATGCYSAPTNDVHYRQAAAASRPAGRAEQPLRENPPGAP